MFKNILRGIFFLTLIFLSLFFGRRSIVSSAECNVAAQDCGLYCSGHCYGTCFYSTRKWVCSGDSPACCIDRSCSDSEEYGDTDCTVWCRWRNYDPRCYWDGGCISTYCDTQTCTDWSAWSPCVNCYEWRHCLIVGIDSQENRYCCGTPSSEGTPTPPPEVPSICEIEIIPSAVITSMGNYFTILADVSVVFGEVDNVIFSSSDTDIVDLSPVSDDSDPFQSTAYTYSTGDTTIHVNVIMNGETRCQDEANISVTPPGPWWQVIDGDILSRGNIASIIPSNCELPTCTPYLNLDGPGGSPGIPIYSDSLYLGTTGSVSSRNWYANTEISTRRVYSYSYFERQVPVDTQLTEILSTSIEGNFFSENGMLSDSAYWFRFDGSSGHDLIINSSVDLGSRKAILFVESADLYINGEINLTDGQGFFMVIVGENEHGEKGDIFINETVGGIADNIPELEGLFLADNQIYTGAGDQQLHIRGSLVGLSGINLQRDLGDADNFNTPSELIEYAPDLILQFPNSLKKRTIHWKEVAP